MLKKLAGYSVGTFFNAAISFIIVILLTYKLAPEQMGQVVIFQAIAALYLKFCLGGLDQSFVREYYESKSRPTLLFLTLGSSVVILLSSFLIFLLFWQEFSTYIVGEADVHLIIMLFLTTVVAILNRYFELIFRMKDLMNELVFFQTLMVIHTLALILLLHSFFQIHGFYLVMWATLLSHSMVCAYQFLYLRRYGQNLFKIEKMEQDYYRKLLDYALPILGVSLLEWLLISSDTFFIKELSDLTELGLYANAYKIIAVMMILHRIITTFWLPQALRWHTEKRPTAAYEFAMNMVALVMLLIGLLIIQLRWVLEFVIDSDFSESIDLLPFLLMYPLFLTLSDMTSVGIQFERKSAYLLYATIGAALVNVAGNILLIPSMGALGAAISTSVSFMAIFVIKTYFSIKLWTRFDLRYLSLVVCLAACAQVAVLMPMSYVLNAVMIVLVAFCLLSQVMSFRQNRNVWFATPVS